MEIDIDYQASEGWNVTLDHVLSPEECAASCQGALRCKAYTWTKDVGARSRCRLQESSGVEIQRPGCVSGSPPPRKTFQGQKTVTMQTGLMYCFSLVAPSGNEPELILW